MQSGPGLGQTRAGSCRRWPAPDPARYTALRPPVHAPCAALARAWWRRSLRAPPTHQAACARWSSRAALAAFELVWATSLSSRERRAPRRPISASQPQSRGPAAGSRIWRLTNFFLLARRCLFHSRNAAAVPSRAGRGHKRRHRDDDMHRRLRCRASRRPAHRRHVAARGCRTARARRPEPSRRHGAMSALPNLETGIATAVGTSKKLDFVAGLAEDGYDRDPAGAVLCVPAQRHQVVSADRPRLLAGMAKASGDVVWRKFRTARCTGHDSSDASRQNFQKSLACCGRCCASGTFWCPSRACSRAGVRALISCLVAGSETLLRHFPAAPRHTERFLGLRLAGPFDHARLARHTARRQQG